MLIGPSTKNSSTGHHSDLSPSLKIRKTPQCSNAYRMLLESKNNPSKGVLNEIKHNLSYFFSKKKIQPMKRRRSVESSESESESESSARSSGGDSDGGEYTLNKNNDGGWITKVGNYSYTQQPTQHNNNNITKSYNMHSHKEPHV